MTDAKRIELPKDATGREIPLGTEVLYSQDGTEYMVVKLEVKPHRTSKWLARLALSGVPSISYPEFLYLTPPDSWEKLLEDLDNTAEKASGSTFIATPCAWFSGGNRHCADCPADEPPEDTCGVKLIKNIAARIRKLRGEDE